MGFSQAGKIVSQVLCYNLAIMKLVFISDLHLSNESTDNNQRFYDLLNQWKGTIDALYILGDFFDYWLGDDDSSPFIEEIKQKLKQFTQLTPTYFIHGNHDFGLADVFAKQTGISYISDCSVINLSQMQILLSHGDVFCTLDIGYQRMKKILRNPFIMWVLRKTPLSWRYKLKSYLENKSSKGFDSKPKHTYHVVDATIAQIAKAKGANIVIHGHTHRPGHYQIKDKLRNITINRYEIPDWQDHSGGGYVILDGDTISICL